MKKDTKDQNKSDRYERQRDRGQMTFDMVFSPIQQVKLRDYV